MTVTKMRTQAPAKKQIALVDMVLNCMAVDINLKVEEMIVGLDISHFKVGHNLFKDAMHALK